MLTLLIYKVLWSILYNSNNAELIPLKLLEVATPIMHTLQKTFNTLMPVFRCNDTDYASIYTSIFHFIDLGQKNIAIILSLKKISLLDRQVFLLIHSTSIQKNNYTEV